MAERPSSGAPSSGWSIALPAVGAFLAVLLLQAGNGSSEPITAEQGEAAEFVLVLLVIVGILALIYTVWNTILAWIASKIVALPGATFGRALKFTIITAMVGVLMTVVYWAIAAGILGFSLFGLLGGEEETVRAVGGASILAFFLLWLLVAIIVAGWIYRIGFFRAFAFLIVLWVVNVAAGIGLRAAGCVSTSDLPADLPGLEQPSPPNGTT